MAPSRLTGMVDHAPASAEATQPIVVQEHFDKTDHQSDLRWKDPKQQFVAYTLAHAEVAPRTTNGPRVQVIGCYPTREEARARAVAVHEHTGATALVSPTHEWFVAARSYERLQDAAALAEHTSDLLERYAAAMDMEAVQEDRRKQTMKTNTENFDEWAQGVGLDAECAARVKAWRDENEFTILRVASMSAAEADTLGVDHAALQAQTADYRAAMGPPKGGESSSDVRKDNEEAERRADEVSADQPDGDRVFKDCSVSRDLELRNQVVAVLSVLDDPTGDEPLVRVYGCCNTETDADAFVRNTAGNLVKDHDLSVVQMYEWIRLAERGEGRVVHRDKTLQSIMTARHDAPTAVEQMRADLEADARRRARESLTDAETEPEPELEEMEQVD